MISIITPIHNCLPHNKLYLESLKKYTFSDYELIIIDNCSTDGSSDLFKEAGCKIIRNEKNLCYPKSINLGIPYAQGEFICFLNNDVFCGVNWDKYLLEAMTMYELDVVSPIGIERMPTLPLTHLFFKRWRKIGEKKHLRASFEELQHILLYMYGDWVKFCERIYKMYYPQIIEGIVGNCVFLKRSVLDKIGMLDETIQSADWDIYLRVKKRAEEIKDIHPVMTVCWSYVHHFIRTTLKNNPAPFSCYNSHSTIEKKWGEKEIKRLWPFPHEVTPRPSFFREPIKYIRYKWHKIKSRRIQGKDENKWIQFWQKLDRT